MNQQKALQLLNTIMPDISTSGDPGSVMLKCARANNLAPAQLEKLAQVFNTMKTNYFMDRQANRGDSFALVDVPDLMTKYATYNPEEHVAPSPVMEQDWTPTFKYASIEGSQLPSLTELWQAAGGKVQDDSTGWVAIDTPEPQYDIMHKAASAPSVTMPSKEEIHRAYEKAKQVSFETALELGEKCASLMEKFTPDNGRWAEAVEDTIFGLGKEAAVAINIVEDYFEDHKHKYKGADLAKRAGANVLARDRHNVWKDMKDICQLVDYQTEAKDLMEKLAYPDPPKGNHSPEANLPHADGGKVIPETKSNILNSVLGNPVNTAVSMSTNSKLQNLADMMLSPHALTQDEKKWKNDMMQRTKRDATLQQLLMSDQILREAEPQHVQDLFNTIADISPTLATNPLLMGPTLKEALQYDAIPTQMLKDLVSIEKDQGTRAKDQLQLDRAL